MSRMLDKHQARHNLTAVGLALVLGVPASCRADYLDGTGEAPYESCGYCHAYDGNASMPGYPHLSGQQPAYLVKQLHDYQDGHRNGDMNGTAELLSGPDIQVVADYFASQPRAPRILEVQPAPAMAQALKLFHNGDPARGISPCTSCHGPDGEGQGRYPGLVAQDETYLEQQLLAFKHGDRRNDLGGLMRTVARKLDTQEIRNLAALLARMGGGGQG